MKNIKCLFFTWVKLINIEFFMNLPLVSLSISDILEIYFAIINSPVLRINFAKIHTDSEVVLSMT